MAQLMVDIAQTYSDRLQIAFKPHPSLLTQLYAHPDWGKERTDQYYELWQQMPNTQLETGQYADLFMTSDAMIHDSGSFVVEYLYANRPVMFVSNNLQSILATQSEFGLQAYKQAYIGREAGDIRHFIDEVVLRENDPMRPQRKQFFSDYLLPPGGKTVAQNIVEDITKSLRRS
jgi:CDP-glycerol glycerophosphotransferase (TagB/SpsB family)